VAALLAARVVAAGVRIHPLEVAADTTRNVTLNRVRKDILRNVILLPVRLVAHGIMHIVAIKLVRAMNTNEATEYPAGKINKRLPITTGHPVIMFLIVMAGMVMV